MHIPAVTSEEHGLPSLNLEHFDFPCLSARCPQYGHTNLPKGNLNYTQKSEFFSLGRLDELASGRRPVSTFWIDLIFALRYS